MAQDPGDVRRPGDVLRCRVHRGEPGRGPGGERVRGVDEDERGRLDAQLCLEDLLCARGLEVVEDEAAGGQRSRGARRQRERGEEDDGPRADDPPAAADGETAETIEAHAWSGSRRGDSRIGFMRVTSSMLLGAPETRSAGTPSAPRLLLASPRRLVASWPKSPSRRNRD